MDKNILRQVRHGSEPEGQRYPERAVRSPALSAQPDLYRATSTRQARAIPGKRGVGEERVLVARFVAGVNALGPLSPASPALQARLLEEVKTVARRIDGSAETGTASGYDRRVLYEDPGHWSLAAIILRPGQQTHPHDHGGWGCAATVQGIERDQRFVRDTSGNLVPSDARDYPPGTGYVFDATDVHQPVGADPRRVTVALHFLVHQSPAEGA